MRRSYDRREFDALCTAIFLEAWYQLEESDPPDRQTFMSELAVVAMWGIKFECLFALSVAEMLEEESNSFEAFIDKISDNQYSVDVNNRFLRMMVMS